MPTTHLITALSAASILASAAIAAGPNLVPTSQTRSTSCSAYAENFNTGESISDGDNESAPDYSPFNSAISANADLFDSFTSSGAIQSSQILPLGISASGSAFATAENFGFDEFNDSSGSSACSVQFTLKAESYIVITGTISASDSGTSQFDVTGPSATIAFYEAFGPFDEQTFSHALISAAGNFTCNADASGSAFGDSFNSDYAFAEYNISLTATCPGDVNLDGVVDVNDISYTLFRLGNAGPAGSFVDGDANADGIVDVNDISYILFRLGDSCL